jgi:hypothetical protein
MDRAGAQNHATTSCSSVSWVSGFGTAGSFVLCTKKSTSTNYVKMLTPTLLLIVPLVRGTDDRSQEREWIQEWTIEHFVVDSFRMVSMLHAQTQFYCSELSHNQSTQLPC